jgi:methylated-DNA-[protein]-cysteine S-methyltransferase
MPLAIVWSPVGHDRQSYASVAVFDAELRMTLAGDVIVDASWCIPHSEVVSQDPSDLALRVQRYLLDPDRELLQVKLLDQGSDYHRRVWQALLEIPLGHAVSYSALAGQLGSGARAVAGACKANPYAGLIPCHRVVAKSGIGGFMGYSSGEMVELKRRILASERQIAQNQA